MRPINLFVSAMALGFVLFVDGSSAVAKEKKVVSGATQVVAKLGPREVTLSELRVEMNRLGLSANVVDAERQALESILNRLALAGAARKGEMHRRPEAILRMRAAQDEALAELYLSVASQPPEPLRSEIDDYIVQNPSLFSKRRMYDFVVLSLATDAFDEDGITPLFDSTSDFTDVSTALKEDGVEHTISLLTQPSVAFPKAIREQLQKYSANDNIVLKGDEQTRILKLTSVRQEPAPRDQWAPLARRILLEAAARKRADKVLARLRKEAKVSYFRSSSAPSSKAAANEGG